MPIQLQGPPVATANATQTATAPSTPATRATVGSSQALALLLGNSRSSLRHQLK
jgi:large exoprotein involved in heme utilization and adhesion